MGATTPNLKFVSVHDHVCQQSLKSSNQCAIILMRFLYGPQRHFICDKSYCILFSHSGLGDCVKMFLLSSENISF